MGAGLPWRGCEGGGIAGIFFACDSAFAASLKLDNSHRGLRWRRYFNPLWDRNIRSDAAQVWELACPGEAAKAAALLAFSLPETALSQTR